MTTIYKLLIALGLAISIGTIVPICLHEGSEVVVRAAIRSETEERVASFALRGAITESCPAQVKLALSEVPGVVESSASVETASATVRFDPAQVSVETLAEIIADATGSEVSLVEVEAVQPKMASLDLSPSAQCS